MEETSSEWLFSFCSSFSDRRSLHVYASEQPYHTYTNFCDPAITSFPLLPTQYSGFPASITNRYQSARY